MLDKVKALSAPPGHSFTHEPGKWAWEQPPRFADPNQAIDFIVEKFKEGQNEDDLLKLMAAGITVEELVSQVGFKGFMQGSFTPDVAELIKPALAIYLYKLGTDNGIIPTMFVPSEADKPEVDDNKFFSILQHRNPEVFSIMNEELNKAARLQEQFAVEENIQNIQDREVQEEGTFLNEESLPEEENIPTEAEENIMINAEENIAPEQTQEEENI